MKNGGKNKSVAFIFLFSVDPDEGELLFLIEAYPWNNHSQ